MVFKGFKDENGNVIPVQGAGTVYNEEKNSLALGKETVATGQDQLVFGRKNIPDPSKVEIVGCGASFALGEVIVPANPDREEDAMIYAGHSLEEFRTFLHNTYGITTEDVVIADEHRTISGTNMHGQTVYIDVPNVADYDDLAFVVFENDFGDDEGVLRLYIYGIDATAGIFFQPFSEVQGSFYFYIEGTTRHFTTQAEDIICGGGMTLRGAVGNPGLGEHGFNSAGNFYKTIMALRDKNIRTLDWEGNEELAGSLTVGTGITIGETSLTEEQLIALKALLNS